MYIYNTRHSDKLFICHVSTTLRKLYVVNSAPILWNELPDSITFSNSLPMLSSAYKNTYFSLYSLNNYQDSYSSCVCFCLCKISVILYYSAGYANLVTLLQ